MAEQNLILDLTFKFSMDSIIFSELLESNRKFNMAKQYWRSSTGIGALVRESQGAESKADFRHKLKIAYKEAEESEYWLLLCKHSVSYPTDENLLEQVLVIKKVLGKIIASTKKEG
ncbi:MAG: four helix bundle protein [Pyrinomonadaceae bacterium]|nr:four helix bundle protein [Sphingobacteriaceae bacterium]